MGTKTYMCYTRWTPYGFQILRGTFWAGTLYREDFVTFCEDFDRAHGIVGFLNQR